MRGGKFLVAAAAVLLASCKVGPNYKRPQIEPPALHRSDPAPDASPSAARIFADVKWFELFQDEQLQNIIRTGLERNYDVLIAAQRVLEARERYTISRSRLYPTIDGNASIDSTRLSTSALTDVPPGTTLQRESGSLGLSMFWELDFWGRIRRGNEAARAEILASEESRHAVYQGLVTDLASGYFQLRELDLELEISRRTLQSRQESLRLVSLREQRGVASLMDVRQSETLVTTAAATIPVVEQQIEQTENFINYLLAQNPGPVPRGKTLVEQVLAPAVPAGLPSTLLDRRPDVRQAEQVLVAENARIGVAKAALFPQISLTGSVGTQSNALSNLFTDPSGFWSVGATLTQPLFNAGRLRANVRAQEARQRQALLGYRDTIQRAFREVADTLIGYQKTREFRQQQEILTKVLTDAARLSRLRYDGGVTSYLEVLDSERQLFDAELDLAQAQRDELISVVQLYRALGGGWQL